MGWGRTLFLTSNLMGWGRNSLLYILLIKINIMGWGRNLLQLLTVNLS
jgi:hypothetical protein